MTFQEKAIYPEKPIYILLGNYSGKKSDPFFPVIIGKETVYPYTKVFRGIITELSFHPDDPGVATSMRLWCNNMGWPEIRLSSQHDYYLASTAQAIRKEFETRRALNECEQ